MNKKYVTSEQVKEFFATIGGKENDTFFRDNYQDWEDYPELVLEEQRRNKFHAFFNQFINAGEMVSFKAETNDELKGLLEYHGLGVVPTDFSDSIFAVKDGSEVVGYCAMDDEFHQAIVKVSYAD